MLHTNYRFVSKKGVNDDKIQHFIRLTYGNIKLEELYEYFMQFYKIIFIPKVKTNIINPIDNYLFEEIYNKPEGDIMVYGLNELYVNNKIPFPTSLINITNYGFKILDLDTIFNYKTKPQYKVFMQQIKAYMKVQHLEYEKKHNNTIALEDYDEIYFCDPYHDDLTMFNTTTNDVEI